MLETLPEAVFFDWDGTLVDTLSWMLNTHNYVRKQMGYEPWSVQEFKDNVRYSSREIYGKIYKERSEEALDILWTYVEENHLKNLEELPDSLELLEYLKDAQIPVGIISNKRHEFLLKEVAHLGWEHLTQVTIGAGFAEKDKPAADPLLIGLSQRGLEPGANIWYVGDSETDMRTAENAGCSAILVRHNHDNKHLIKEHNPLFVFDDCKSLQSALFSCNQQLRKEDCV